MWSRPAERNARVFSGDPEVFLDHNARMAYVHGYTSKEATRLGDQATTLTELLHGDTAIPPAAAFSRPAAASVRRR